MDKVIYYLLFDYNLVQDKSKNINFEEFLIFQIKFTGHLIGFDDHLKTFKSTIVDVHVLSSSLGTFPINLFVQVLSNKIFFLFIKILTLIYSGVRPHTAG